jgi:hypothetical protein
VTVPTHVASNVSVLGTSADTDTVDINTQTVQCGWTPDEQVCSWSGWAPINTAAYKTIASVVSTRE